MIVSYAVADETGARCARARRYRRFEGCFPTCRFTGGLAQEEREAMLCARTPALEALAVELSEVADGRRELDAAYAGGRGGAFCG